MASIFSTSTTSDGLGINLNTDTGFNDIPTTLAANLDLQDSDCSPVRPPVSHLLSERTLHPNTNVNLYNFTSNRNAGELNAILGNEQSRLKSGATLVQYLESELDEHEIPLGLEKAMSKSRVEVDLFLENDVCVEGGVLRGRVDVRIREHKKKAPILISGGKMRVIGFETVSGDSERFTFYQCSALLADIAYGLERLCSSKPDQDGFSTAHEGVHHIPFELPLNLSEGGTIPKGTTYITEGLSVCYIVMVSFRIKDPISGKKSIAHFYRNCVIWPRLNPSIVLAPTSRPLQLSNNIQTGKAGEIHLTASLHRLHWVAGQFCHIQLKIFNKSNKMLETVTFDLLRTVTVFKIVQKPDGDEPHLQSSHQTKSVAQGVLSIAERGKRGHASASGWWAGIAPGETQTLRYPMLIPHDELSIPRGKLLQVSYNIRTTVSGAKRRAKDVQVSLPIEIINFLSVDPPPSSVISAPTGVHREPSFTDRAYNLESEGEGHGSDVSDHEYQCQDEQEYKHVYEDGEDGTGNLHLHDDTDEVVHHAVLHARVDAEYGKSAPRFSDLYYSSMHDEANNGGHKTPSGHEEAAIEEFEEIPGRNQFKARFEAKKREYERRRTLLEDEVAREEMAAGLRQDGTGYFPPIDHELPTKDKGECTCDNGRADPLGPELPKPPRPLTRSLASSRETHRYHLYDQPPSGGHEPRYDDSQPILNRSLAVPCQTPGQINSPSIPRSGTVKDKIRTLETLDDAALQ